MFLNETTLALIRSDVIYKEQSVNAKKKEGQKKKQKKVGEN